MPREIDPDVQILANVAGWLKSDYVKEGAADPWFGSPFAWIKTRPSRQIGKIGEQLVASWCAAKKLDVTKSPDSEADRVIGRKRVEIKFSTLWENGGYTFQQIRDQNYEICVCLGVSPFSAHCWVLPKSVLRQHVIGHRPQHGGKAGSDTSWLQIPEPGLPETWLKDWGGTLPEAFQILKRLATAK